jgi:hypothetical protein
MRAERPSLGLAARVEPHDVVRYAQARGWVLARTAGTAFHVLTHPESELDQVLVPRDAQADDFAARVVEAAERLAERERRSPDAVLSDILSPAADVLRFRVRGADVERWDITFPHLANVISGIDKCLRAAACSVVKPQPFHPRLSRSEADQLMAACRLRQTEPGSFTVVVACPLDAVDRPAAPDDPAPFARHVIQGLMRSLQWIDRAAHAPMLVTPGDVPSPVSANLCEGLLDMLPEDERGSLSVDVAWDASLAPPRGMELGVAPTLRREHFSFLGELARTLRPRDGELRPVPLVGHVDRLNGAPDENGHVCGEVVLSLLIDDAVLRARADLGPDDYVKAIDAHRWNRLVRLSGVLRRGRKVHRVDDVSGFAPVDSPDP